MTSCGLLPRAKLCAISATGTRLFLAISCRAPPANGAAAESQGETEMVAPDQAPGDQPAPTDQAAPAPGDAPADTAPPAGNTSTPPTEPPK